MTTFAVPAHVEDNQRKRALANQRRTTCLYDCGAPARLYKDGVLCDEHAPKPANPVPDPARTLAGLRAAVGLNPDATFLPAHTVLDQRAVDSGRRVSGVRRRAARDDG